VLDEWEIYWELARRLGTPIQTARGPLPMDVKPDKFTVLEHITHGCRVPLARVREETRDGGRVFADATLHVEAADAGASARFELVPDGIAAELRAVRGEPLDPAGRAIDARWPATHLLVNRRTRQFFNSTGQDLERLRVKGITNYAHMHPDDLATLAIDDDTVVEISTAHATLLGVARASPDIKRGVISMAHAFGARGEDSASVRAHGASTNRLVDDEHGYDPITGACRQSAIPVRVRRA
jgi:anaerobic selenocysteine-containing dehydrogenase